MKRTHVILLVGIFVVVAGGVFLLTRTPQPAQIQPMQPVETVPTITNSDVATMEHAQTAIRPITTIAQVTNAPATNEVATGRIHTESMNSHTAKTNQMEEVFKTVVYPSGGYVCTDTGRQTFYFRGKNGGGPGPANIFEFLHIKPDATNMNDKITGITTDGTNMVIYFEGQPHVVKLYGGKGDGNN